MLHQSIVEEELVFKNKDHQPKEMEVEVDGRVLVIEMTEYGVEITRFVSSNPMDYLNAALEPRVFS